MKSIRSESLVRAALVALFGYLLALGATFNGAVLPDFGVITLALMAVTAAAWLSVRWRRGWTWHSTPLDGVFLLWALAFALSILANGETWRRSAIGLWYMGLYIGVWYLLNDWIANRAMKREMLFDALLFGGLIVLLFGGVQVFAALSEGGSLPRLVSTFGNPNFLGGFLVVLIPLALGRLASVRSRLGQMVLGLYTLAAGLLLLLTLSRGAWLGLAAGIAVWIALFFAQRDLLAPGKLRAWWSGQTARVKAWGGAAALLLIVGGMGIGFFLLRSLSEPGRDVGLRTYLYNAALTLFSEKPLTGYGLFTFGRYLGRFSSIPPNTPHAHAHNAPLHIAAELGIVGLIALAATLAVMVVAIRRNWRVMQGRERALLSGAVAAVCGFAVHQQLDVPAMMPAIALTGLLALVLALSPAEPTPITARWRLIGQPIGVAVLAVGLLVSGLWDMSIYTRYLDALRTGVNGDPDAAADQLQSVIEADPAMPIYRAQQAYFLALTADERDLNTVWPVMDAYEIVTGMEPFYSPYWANRAAVYFVGGEYTNAMDALDQAAMLAPDAWQFYYGLGAVAEHAEDHELRAIEVYKKALNAHPDAYLHPDWGNWPLQIFVIERGGVQPTPSPLAQAVLHLEADDAEAALESWTRDDSGTLYSPTARSVVRAMIALAQDDRALAARLLERLRPSAAEDTAWLHLGLARLAQFDGDPALAEQELSQARAALDVDLMTEDVRGGLSFAYGQFLRQALPRQLLPRVYYPMASPLLAYVLKNFDANPQPKPKTRPSNQQHFSVFFVSLWFKIPLRIFGGFHAE